MTDRAGYWPEPVAGGGRRARAGCRCPAVRPPGPGLGAGAVELAVTHRESPGTTMVVLRDPGEVYLLRHGFGADASCWVEQIDPVTLEVVRPSPDLPGGPTWPGGLAAHADGSLHVVFGNHAHRLAADLAVLAVGAAAPRTRPYNSFVMLPDGHLVTKDFGGRVARARPDEPRDAGRAARARPRDPGDRRSARPCPEPSIARLSADGDDVYVVGDTEPAAGCAGTAPRSTLDDGFAAPYRTLAGQTYGWDAVLAAGRRLVPRRRRGHRALQRRRSAARGSRPRRCTSCASTWRRGAVTLTEVCGLPGRARRQPAARRRPTAASWSATTAATACWPPSTSPPTGAVTPRWRRDQDHACHPLAVPGHRRAGHGRPRPRADGRPGRGPRHRDRRRAGPGRHRQPAAVRRVPRRRVRTATSTCARCPR